MKSLRIFILIASLGSFSFAHAGTDIFDQVAPSIEGTWDGYWTNGYSYGETFEVKATPRSYVETKHRQVGSNNTPEIPYPTVCKYRQYANPTIEKCDPSDSYCNYGSEPSKYIFSFEVTKVELIPDASNDVACAAFITQQEGYMKNGGLRYSFPFHVNANGELVQYGEDIYKRK